MTCSHQDVPGSHQLSKVKHLVSEKCKTCSRNRRLVDFI